MAKSISIVSDALNFGNVLVGTYTDIAITITNTGATGTGNNVNITAASITAPFSLVTTPSFPITLTPVPDPGTHSLVLTIRYTPIDYVLSDEVLSIAHNADVPISPFSVPLTGMGAGLVTEYQLPTIYHSAAGDIKCFLYTMPSVPALTIPQRVNILNIGETHDAVDIEPGKVSIDNLLLNIADDYSTYPIGFWYNLLQGYPKQNVQLMFILNEGGTYTFLFRGTVFRENARYNEPYINNSTFVRVHSLQLVSPIYTLKDVTLSYFIDLVTVINSSLLVSAYQDVLPGLVKGIKLSDLIRSMLSAGMGVAIGDTACISRNDDIQFYDSNTSNYYGAFDGYLITHLTYGGVDYRTGLFAKVGDDYYHSVANPTWCDSYNNCWDLLGAICNSLGVVPRYYYGDSTGVYTGTSADKHTIEFVTRGNSTTTVTMGKSIQGTSNVVSNSTKKQLNIRVTDALGTGGSSIVRWFNNGIYGTGDADKNASFNLDILQWFFNPGYLQPVQIHNLYTGTSPSGNHFNDCKQLKYYKYSTKEWIVVNYYSPYENMMVTAILNYFFYRFTGGRREIPQEYGSLKADNGSTNSQQNLRIMVQKSIDDGIAAANFYAGDVRKNTNNGHATVTFVEE